MSRTRTLSFLAFGAIAAALLVSTAGPARAGGAGVTLSASSTTVSNGDVVDLTASLPVADATGTITNEIVQKIDPTKTHLRSIENVVAPAEWTVSYSYDGGTTWTTTEPSSETGESTSWDKVNAVKAAGTMQSGGSSGGKQLVTGSDTFVPPPSGTFVNQGTGGDGWVPFFDSADHVFNVWHHMMLRLACATRLGVTCGAAWPFGGTSPFFTPYSSTAIVDDVMHRVWIGVYTKTGSVFGQSTGFVCVDIANIATPRYCGGSTNAAYRKLGPGINYDNAGPLGLVRIGTRLYQWDPTGKLECLDMAGQDGDGTACPGQPYSFTGINFAGMTYDRAKTLSWRGNLVGFDGKVYGLAAAGVLFGGFQGTGTVVPAMSAICWDPATDAPCTGWEAPKPLPVGKYTNFSYVLPDSSGVPQGVCFQEFNLNTGNDATCFKSDGTTLAENATFARGIRSSMWYAGAQASWPITVGKRIYWTGGEGTYVNGLRNVISCFDVETNAVCSGGWPMTYATRGTRAMAYAISIDPQNSACLWKNDDRNSIAAINVYDTTQTTCGPPLELEFKAATLVPRLACSATNAIESWKDFTLTSPAPAGYASAKLTVLDSDGTRLAGWIGASPTGTDGSSNPVWDLSSLSVGDTGQQPSFLVSLSGRTSNDPTSVTLSAVAVAPQLCLTTHVATVCQTTPGPLLPLAWTQTLTASATVQVDSDPVQTLDDATVDLQANAPPTAECGAILRGTTFTTTGDPVPNATVDLLDDNGDPVMSGGVPVSTLADSNGHYAFAPLGPGRYRVRFRNEVGNDIHKASTHGGAPGTDWGTTFAHGNELPSLMVRLDPGDTGIIDGVYISLTLPATGTNPGSWLAVAGLLLASGLVLRRLTRRRPTTA